MRIRTFGGLWIEGLTGSPALGPRRLALLALVAASGRRGISRDRVIGILWPDAEEEQARHTLSQTLYTMKRDTGRDCIMAGPELRLDPSVSSEIGELLDALAGGSLDTVDALASGIFLEGFYLAGAPEFERWVEEERSRLRSAVLRLLEQHSAGADDALDHRTAIRWWTRLTELEPLSSRYAMGRMRALAAAGDRASALSHARAYENLVRRELETDVDPAIRKLVAALRAEMAPPVQGADVPASASPKPVTALPQADAVPIARRRRWVYLLPVAAIAVIGWVLLIKPDSAQDTPFLAVGDIRIDQPADSSSQGSVLRDMLATSLSAVEGLQVVANSRLIELLPRRDSGQAAPVSDAARRAGATEVIEGELAIGPAGMILSLRRVDLATGVLRKGYVIRAADRYAVVDSAAAAIARDLQLAAPSVSVAQVRTSSAAAYALYDEGLRAHFGYDAPAAYRLMTAALTHDSTFAMAAYYAWWLARILAVPETTHVRLLDRVTRLAQRTTEHERLLILTATAGVDAPLYVAVARAESLTVKYPSDPDGQYLLAGVRGAQGDWAASISASQRVIALDSAAGALYGAHCRACQALAHMGATYIWWDSAAAAERTARRLATLRPDEPGHWLGLGEPLLRQGRRAEAEAAAERSGRANAADGMMHRDLLRWGRYEEADRILVRNALSLDPAVRGEAWWLLTLSLRDQGRLQEADTVLREQRIPGTRQVNPQRVPDPVDVALLGMEMGRPHLTVQAHRRNVARLNQAIGPPGLRARAIVWNLVLAATAYASAGDSATVGRLADSVEIMGRDSPWARDTRLHHMLRGLVHQIAGRHAQAVEAFQRSFYSLTDGYTRTNLLMARSLLVLRRPAEAIAVLRPAIHGGVDGNNSYVSRTELHEVMAQAFEMAGPADSARVHYAIVERSWRRADPQYKTRYETARAKAGAGI